MSRRILVVDDEPGLASLYAAWLEGQYDVETATDGATALAAVEDGVGAILLDRQMPGRSGDEVLACLRRRGHRCPVALVTAARPDRAAFDLSFDAYLHKPVDAAAVEDCVDRLLTIGEYDGPERRCARLAAKVAVARRVAEPGVRERVVGRLEGQLEAARRAADAPVAGAVGEHLGDTGAQRASHPGSES
jgi:CheY-like chemotaxis protein